MRRFNCRHVSVLLTDERRQHIAAFHPDVTFCFRYFAETLKNPDSEVRSVHDASVLICYRYLTRHKKHLAIVLKTGVRPFIITAYLAEKPKRDTI